MKLDIYSIKALLSVLERMDVPTAIKHNSQAFNDALVKAIPKEAQPTHIPMVTELYGVRVIVDTTMPPDRIRLEYTHGGDKRYEEFVLS